MTAAVPLYESTKSLFWPFRLSSVAESTCVVLMLVSLPDGVMVVLAGSSDTSRMLWNGNLLRWSFDGYSDPLAAKEIRTVDVFNTGFNLRYFCDWLPP